MTTAAQRNTQAAGPFKALVLKLDGCSQHLMQHCMWALSTAVHVITALAMCASLLHTVSVKQASMAKVSQQAQQQ